ncbi:MerR family DNA-binding protein [Micromonospora sagamiensis]|uniref:MerR-like DNA binding protein n=1 Tax=Micromonospora sagamiensis TaxID=47875 RepID=A0A562WEL9_9ACTN|nr:MerR family DNA-binding protein [Micromonospora sagamiensis]TWJ28575.1 MerR-like DNA binding protein [Micromonospora sagamiensis]BCL12522.1 hypothetical protein GCM10017556_02610 [Micromonospora sagamiensis]
MTDTVALLTVIKAAQRLGFTLDEVADLLDAGRRRHHPAPVPAGWRPPAAVQAAVAGAASTPAGPSPTTLDGDLRYVSRGRVTIRRR